MGKRVLSVCIKRTYGKHTQRLRDANEGANLFRKAHKVWESIIKSTWGDFLSQRHSASSEEGLFFLPEAVGLHLTFSRFHCRTILFLAFKGKREWESAGSGLNRHFSVWLPIQERTWAGWETARSYFIYSGRNLLPLRQILHFFHPGLWQASHNCLFNHKPHTSLLSLAAGLSIWVQSVALPRLPRCSSIQNYSSALLIS